jgi:hypothetical protein
MTRMIGLWLTWFVLAIGIVHAVPARPLYEPPPENVPIELGDTEWVGVEAADQYFAFHRDGTLSYVRGQKGNASWKIEGNILYFEINNKYREFRGVVQGHVIQGESWNVAGRRWPTELKQANVAK